MRFGKSQVDIAKLLSKVSPIYQNFFIKDIQRMPLFKDGYNALVLFLDNYAYERQGAAKAYPKIAVRCVSNKYKNPINWTCPTKDDAESLWTEYQKIASEDYNLKVNEKRNPMNENDGVISRLASNGISNIADYVKNRMSCGKTTEAHNFLKSIRGIGEKIASFYLRDIAYLAGFDEKNISNLRLLQPMDTWLEQTLRILFGPDVSMTLREKQKKIVDLCQESEVSSISFNQGAWILGSQIAGEFGTFEGSLTNYNSARKIIEDHMKEKEGYLCVVKNVLDNLQ